MKGLMAFLEESTVLAFSHSVCQEWQIWGKGPSAGPQGEGGEGAETRIQGGLREESEISLI